MKVIDPAVLFCAQTSFGLSGIPRSLRLTLAWRGDQHEPTGLHLSEHLPIRPARRRVGPMNFLVIRKPRTGAGMIPTANMVRAQKELLLEGLSNVETRTAPTPFWAEVVSVFRTPIPP